ncbi:mechanosensitive ion channel family protein [Pseudorhodoplanes sinuspersici]|uniref:Mechanosensitive ion channel protein MscS n=1 Tax=Pseudorhodoplanes sinuspersici TaxID=1235591 RepID=A0A1W6ZZ61_9HYPH|nr:mechanosensitive ion channel domain-containing protein [Pseudorhodoplanes sinuspersici]ARQ02045.1 mechanosensitive ion channel protein MscS [Pseudorhodoplanes sinuspersici]RKE73836.1 small-conductance mechanosensitive channel [Pseudorhodoplanes sinuspersici]
MTDLFWNLWTWIDSVLEAIPAPIAAIFLLAGAIAAAMLLFSIIVRLTRHLFAVRHPILFSFLRRTKGVLRFALILLALSVAARNAPLNQDVAGALGRIFQVGFIVMIGWLAIVGANLLADIYLLRFRIDTEDNLLARKHVTQVRILKGAVQMLIIVITAASGLMTFEVVRQFGVSLFASAGIAGIVVGFAARPLLSSLIAGMQIAMTQPIRIDDAVVVENEWGWIEEIKATYVVIKLWDWRRMVVPLSYFMEKPFQNWTRETASLIGTVYVNVDYTVPVEEVRQEAYRIARESKLWDRNVINLQVTDAKSNTIELRILASGRNSPEVFDLRCEIREKIIDYLQREHPDALPRARQEQYWHNTPSLVPGGNASKDINATETTGTDGNGKDPALPRQRS